MHLATVQRPQHLIDLISPSLSALVHSKPRGSGPHRAVPRLRRRFYVRLCPLIRPPKPGESPPATVCHVQSNPHRPLGYRTSIMMPSTMPQSKTRTARPTRKVPVATCLRRPWAALRPSRYAFPKLVYTRYLNPRRCAGAQKIYVWWWRWRWRLTDAADQHGYGRGF
jgi:hypothetical protein